MVDVGVPGLNRAAAVEAPALLVAVQGIPRAGDRPAADSPALDDQQLSVGLVCDGQDVPGRVQVPRGLDQPPPGLDLDRQVPVLEVRADLAQLVREPDALGGLAPFIEVEPDGHLGVVHDVERVDNVAESEPGGLVGELGLGQLAPVEGPARFQEPALGRRALLVRQREVLADVPGERDGQVIERDLIAILAGEFVAGPGPSQVTISLRRTPPTGRRSPGAAIA